MGTHDYIQFNIGSTAGAGDKSDGTPEGRQVPRQIQFKTKFIQSRQNTLHRQKDDMDFRDKRDSAA